MTGSPIDSVDRKDFRDPQVFGRLFFDNLFRILKVGSIYNVEHNQTRLAVEEFFLFFQEVLTQNQDKEFSVLIRDELALVNGETLRLDRMAQKRHNELRDIFAKAHIRGIHFSRGLNADDFVSFLTELHLATSSDEGMKHASIPHIEIAHGKPIRSILEAVANVDHSAYVTHLYVRGIVKVQNMHEQVKLKGDANAPLGVVRRILQTISELLADDDFLILGVMSMGLVPADLPSHSLNTAIYAMLIADRLGLPSQTCTHIGMAALYQDLDRLTGIVVGYRDRVSSLKTQQQFGSNLRDVARMLPTLDGSMVSTLRMLMTYERGCAFDTSITPPFYRVPRSLHLVTRLLDVCRTYDLLIQGIGGYKPRRTDLAIQYIESRAGESFDESLVELFVSTMGIFPIGTIVELTSGERAMVIRTPESGKDPRRPVIKINGGAQRGTVLDLSDPRFANIEVARSVTQAEEDAPTARMFLLT